MLNIKSPGSARQSRTTPLKNIADLTFIFLFLPKVLRSTHWSNSSSYRCPGKSSRNKISRRWPGFLRPTMLTRASSWGWWRVWDWLKRPWSLRIKGTVVRRTGNIYRREAWRTEIMFRAVRGRPLTDTARVGNRLVNQLPFGIEQGFGTLKPRYQFKICPQ